MKRINSAKKGFTLVEMLVTMSIVSSLAVVGTMSVKKAIVSANQAKCASNMRQIGLSLQQFAQDNNDTFPLTSHSTGTRINQAWIYQLRTYIGSGFDNVRVSPGDPKRVERQNVGGSSYTLNSFLFVPEYGPFGELISAAKNKPTLIADPSRTLIAFTISENAGVGAQNDHTHSERWTSWSAVVRDISPDLFRKSKAAADHSKGSSNYLYVDGHVESHKASILKERIESGINFAKPPE